MRSPGCARPQRGRCCAHVFARAARQVWEGNPFLRDTASAHRTPGQHRRQTAWEAIGESKASRGL